MGQVFARSGLPAFKTKTFVRFVEREGLEDSDLCEALWRTAKGLIDANLSNGVIKQRIARKAGGRPGGFRAIMLFRRGELAFFVYGFAKSGRANLRRTELEALRLLAEEALGMTGTSRVATVANGEIIEVRCDD